MANAIKPIDEVRGALTRMSDQFKMALPPQIPVERFVRVVQTAVASNPDLLNCERTSLYGAAMKCAQDGLLPDGREAALVKFGGQVSYMPMVGGILKKVSNSGELETISSHVVYDKDHFDYILGDDEKIEHKPFIGENRGKPILTYAIAKTKDGGIYREVMTEFQIQAVRNISRAKDSGPWSGPFADEMRRKTAIRRLSKRLPMSTDLDDLIRRDDDLYDVNQPQEPKDVTPPAGAPAAAQAEQTGKRRPKALDKVANAGKPEDQQSQEQQQPGQGDVIDGSASQINDGQQHQDQQQPPADII